MSLFGGSGDIVIMSSTPELGSTDLKQRNKTSNNGVVLKKEQDIPKCVQWNENSLQP